MIIIRFARRVYSLAIKILVNRLYLSKNKLLINFHARFRQIVNCWTFKSGNLIYEPIDHTEYFSFQDQEIVWEIFR